MEFTSLVRDCKKQGISREETLFRVSQLEGFYVPALYDVEYNEDGTISSFMPNRDIG